MFVVFCHVGESLQQRYLAAGDRSASVLFAGLLGTYSAFARETPLRSVLEGARSTYVKACKDLRLSHWDLQKIGCFDAVKVFIAEAERLILIACDKIDGKLCYETEKYGASYNSTFMCKICEQSYFTPQQAENCYDKCVASLHP